MCQRVASQSVLLTCGNAQEFADGNEKYGHGQEERQDDAIP